MKWVVLAATAVAMAAGTLRAIEIMGETRIAMVDMEMEDMAAAIASTIGLSTHLTRGTLAAADATIMEEQRPS